MEQSPGSMDQKMDFGLIAQVLKKSEISAVEYLTFLLLDENKWVRYVAAKALGEIGDARGVKGLRAALRDTDQDVRIAATRSLWMIGKLGDAQAFRALIAC
jgi:HEAT repeat protein